VPQIEFERLVKREVAARLETKLQLRPHRSHLEAKGKIKDKATVEKERSSLQAKIQALDAAMLDRPTVDHLVSKRLITNEDARKKLGFFEPPQPKLASGLLAVASVLEGKLARQPEKHRLETRGLIKNKAEKEETMASVKAALENKLMARQPREHHEAKGRIKDQSTHARVQFEKKRNHEKARAALDIHLAKRTHVRHQPPHHLRGEAHPEDQAHGTSDISDKQSWLDRADLAFHFMDLDSSGDLSKNEVMAVIGPSADAMLRQIPHDDAGCITNKAWMNHVHKIQATHGHEGVLSFLSFVEDRLSQYVHRKAEAVVSAKAKTSQDLKKISTMDAIKTSLENKLNVRQPREHHEAKGRIKDKETHDEHIQLKIRTMQQTAAILESHLQQRPPSPTRARDYFDHPESGFAKSAGYDWRNRTEHIFEQLDLDGSGTLEKEEIEAVLGSPSTALLTVLQHDADTGKVGIREWVSFVGQLLNGKNPSDFETFLGYCEHRVEDYKFKIDVKRKSFRQKQQSRKKKAFGDSDLAASLEQKLTTRLEKGRLEEKGIIKTKDQVHVQKMNKHAATSQLHTKMSLRQPREHHEANHASPIKHAEHHAEQRKSRIDATNHLDSHFRRSPPRQSHHAHYD